MYTDLSSSESLVLHTWRGLIDCRGRWRGGGGGGGGGGGEEREGKGGRGEEREGKGGRGEEREGGGGERERGKLGGNPKYAEVHSVHSTYIILSPKTFTFPKEK